MKPTPALLGAAQHASPVTTRMVRVVTVELASTENTSLKNFETALINADINNRSPCLMPMPDDADIEANTT